MKIILGKTAGFCFGVANAVNKTDDMLKKYKDLYCLGELVHNKQVLEELEEKGLHIINNIVDAKKNVIIRAHGEKKEIYVKAKNFGLNVIDLTCPKVANIHKMAEEYAKRGYYIFLIGNKAHPEIIGTISYCGQNSTIIERKEDIEKALQNLYNSNIKNLVILEQTTFNLEEFNKMINLIEKELKGKKINLEIKRTICDATRLRQRETRDISSKVDIMIIIGGRNSSNTKKLYEISKQYCKNSILIETVKDLNLEQFKLVKEVGIMAGASTPKKSMENFHTNFRKN